MVKNKNSFSIAYKLILITVGLVVLVTGLVTIQGTQLFKKFSIQREEDALAELVNSVNGEVESSYSAFVNKTQLFGGMFINKKKDIAAREEFLNLSFYQDTDILSMEIFKDDGAGPVLEDRIVNAKQVADLHIHDDFVNEIRAQHKLNFSQTMKGSIEIHNGSLPDGLAISTIMLPLVKDSRGYFTYFAVADFRIDKLQKTLKQIRSRSVYIVDSEGLVLLAPSDQEVLAAKSIADLPLFQTAVKSNSRFGQLDFLMPNSQVQMVGTFIKSTYGMTTLMFVEESKITKVARVVTNRTLVIVGYTLSAIIFIIFLFSLTLTNPIEKLVAITKEIAKGNFEVDAKIKSHDEVGELADSIDQMLGGLRERDKMKNVLNKFHGSSVTEDLLKNDIQLGGSRKKVTVFFSDVRDFTKFSEGHSPEEVVEMLNEYFTIMVRIISKNHGIVDKFVGDAIMAVWGSPKSTGEDALNCVRASLEMRVALNQLNEKRIARGQTPIKIGMGAHTGDVISGNIGSDERMEYTVIGDTVNMSSRIESATKAFGTDFLVSEQVVKELESKIGFIFAGAAEVKGKAEPLKMFKVQGPIDASGKVQEIKTPYSEYQAEAVDKVKL